MIPNLAYWFYKYITGPTYRKNEDHWRMSEPDLIKFVSAHDNYKVYYTLRVNKDTEECTLVSTPANPWTIEPINETFPASECLTHLKNMDLLEGWDPERCICSYTEDEIKKYEDKPCGQSLKL